MRNRFIRFQRRLPVSRVFFVDETGSTCAMARDHARAPIGERAQDTAPRNYGDVLTVIGALTTFGLTALMTISGGTTAEVFAAYCRGVLAPHLQPGDVVVFDNLAAHKNPVVREIIERRGARIVFLPPYSPDLNPIELAWSWVKRWLKTCRARCEDGLNNALHMAIDLIEPEMAVNWIRHCGYLAQLG